RFVDAGARSLRSINRSVLETLRLAGARDARVVTLPRVHRAGVLRFAIGLALGCAVAATATGASAATTAAAATATAATATAATVTTAGARTAATTRAGAGATARHARLELRAVGVTGEALDGLVAAVRVVAHALRAILVGIERDAFFAETRTSVFLRSGPGRS